MESIKTSYKKCLLEFIGELHKTFPDNKEISNCEKVKEKINYEKHIKYFQIQISSVKEDFVSKNLAIFDNDIYFIPTINFSPLMKNTTTGNQNAIWKYLHTLYLLGQQVSAFEKNEDLNTEELSKIVENLQEKVETGSSLPNFNLEDLLGGNSDNVVNNKMNDLVKNLASNLTQGGQNPMSTLQNPDGFKNLFNQVKGQVENLCENEQFQKEDLENYAENIKGNLQNKLNIPLDDLMKNIQNMVGPMMNATSDSNNSI